MKEWEWMNESCGLSPSGVLWLRNKHQFIKKKHAKAVLSCPLGCWIPRWGFGVDNPSTLDERQQWNLNRRTAPKSRRGTEAARSVGRGGAGPTPLSGSGPGAGERTRADSGAGGGSGVQPAEFPPAMDDELSFSDIYGGRLALQRRYYSPSCREFCLSCPRLSLRSLTAVTCTVWLAAYGLFTLCEVIAPRPFPRPVSGTGLWKGLWSFGIEPRPKAGGQELALSRDAVPLLDSILSYI